MKMPGKLVTKMEELGIANTFWDIESEIYKKGFIDCFKELEPLIEALKFYTNGRSVSAPTIEITSESDMSKVYSTTVKIATQPAREALENIGIKYD